jgi:hypothetical protein
MAVFIGCCMVFEFRLWVNHRRDERKEEAVLEAMTFTGGNGGRGESGY